MEFHIHLLILTSLCVLGLVLAVWLYCTRPERFTPEQIDQLAERVMNFKNSGMDDKEDEKKGGKEDDKSDEKEDDKKDKDDEDSVEVSAEFGLMAVGLYKNKKSIYDKILKHAKSPRAFDLAKLGEILDIPCVSTSTAEAAGKPKK